MTTKANKVVLYAPVVMDIALLICLFIWLGIAVNQFESRRDPCENKYRYGDCLNLSECEEDSYCSVYNVKLGYERGTCSGDCNEDCRCYPAQSLYTLLVMYVLVFLLVMVMEIVKGIIIMCSAINGQCCCCGTPGCCRKPEGGCCDPDDVLRRSCFCDSKNDPVEMTCISRVADSWAMIPLRIFDRKRYEEIVKANEEGRLPVWTCMRLQHVILRDIVVTLVISLYIPVRDYFNGWFVVYIVLVLAQWFCLRKRAEFANMIRTSQRGEEAVALQAQSEYVIPNGGQPQMYHAPQAQQHVMEFNNQPYVSVYYPQQQPLTTSQVQPWQMQPIDANQEAISHESPEGR